MKMNTLSTVALTVCVGLLVLAPAAKANLTLEFEDFRSGRKLCSRNSPSPSYR